VRYGIAVGVAVLGVLAGSATAHADPVTPGLDTACAPNTAGAFTRLPDDVTVVECSGGRWRAVEDPYPHSDRWLTYGPTLTLHGEGQRNREIDSGDWTGYPLQPGGQCTVQQMSIAEAGGTTPPEVSTGEPDQPLRLQLRPLLFTVVLGGSCLWQQG
jgi:hypothetical protein